ncbi:uncharacterized protein LOC142359660 isoform X2 [Opisthocomus hoazin]|uniref:uncharacterized protein LOC142359660 isoform X2 n=1 Tax=Opisthocomus hoazin TaxID=30419 RepID=UPI003F534BAE
MELIFLLVAAVVRVSEEENVDSGHVPSHHHQSRPFPSFPCPGGRATRQTAEPANGNAPHHGRRALFMDGAGHGDVELSAFWFSGSLNPLSARSLNFLRAAHRSPNASPFAHPPPHPAGGKGKGERAAVQCRVKQRRAETLPPSPTGLALASAGPSWIRLENSSRRQQKLPVASGRSHPRPRSPLTTRTSPRKADTALHSRVSA